MFEKYKNTTSPFRFMGCAKNCMKIAKKNWVKIAGYTSKSEVCNSYSILFNLCDGPGFYHRCQNERNRVRLFISTLLTEKMHFHVVLYKIGKKLSPWKMKKSWKSPGIPFSQFPCEPCLNTMFCLLSVSCLVVELFCSHTHDRYANSMLYR